MDRDTRDGNISNSERGGRVQTSSNCLLSSLRPSDFLTFAHHVAVTVLTHLELRKVNTVTWGPLALAHMTHVIMYPHVLIAHSFLG